jgi:hypothetical protein
VSERLTSRLCDEIDALRAELERTRVALHVEAAAADAEATFANELNVDVAELRAERDRLAARVRELEGARVAPKTEPVYQCPRCECIWRGDELLADDFCPGGCGHQLDRQQDEVTQ